MSRKKHSKRVATRSRARRIATRTKTPKSRRVLAALCLAFVLLASAGILAARRSSRIPGKPQQLQTQSAQLSPQSTTPSKQYVYAGGKLIATVEPTSSPTPPPAGSIALNAAALPASVSLAWTYSGSGQQQFKVERRTGNFSDPNNPPFAIVGTTVPTLLNFVDKDAAIVPGGTYQYEVIANSNTGGDSAPSNIVTVTVPTGAPAAPSALSAIYVASGPEVDLHWTDNSSNETGFKVERAPASQPFVQIATVCQGSQSYVDNTVTGPANYTYQVKAYNADGDSAPAISGMVSIPLPAPVASMVSCGTSVQISWTESVAVDSFTVFRNGSPLPGNIPPGSQTLPSTTNFTDNTAPSQSPLTYTVVAHLSGYADSAQSSGVTCSTPAGCQVTTFSGSSTYGYQDGLGIAAQWKTPQGAVIARDPASPNYYALYIADTENHRIRRVYLEGPNQGQSSLIAGSGVQGYAGGHGDAINANLNNPRGITAVTDANNIVTALIIGDSDNHMIRKITPPNGGPDWGITDLCGHYEQPAGFADGDSQTALFDSPQDVAIGTDGFIYVIDSGNNDVRRVDLLGNTTTVAIGANTGMGFITGITVSRSSGLLYVADQSGNAIWQVSTGGQVTSLGATVNRPYHLAWATGEVLYIAARGAHEVVKLPIGTSCFVYAGTGVANWADGACTSVAQFNNPRGVAMGPAGEVYITDSSNNRIRRIQ